MSRYPKRPGWWRLVCAIRGHRLYGVVMGYGALRCDRCGWWTR